MQIKWLTLTFAVPVVLLGTAIANRVAILADEPQQFSDASAGLQVGLKIEGNLNHVAVEWQGQDRTSVLVIWIEPEAKGWEPISMTPDERVRLNGALAVMRTTQASGTATIGLDSDLLKHHFGQGCRLRILVVTKVAVNVRTNSSVKGGGPIASSHVLDGSTCDNQFKSVTVKGRTEAAEVFVDIPSMQFEAPERGVWEAYVQTTEIKALQTISFVSHAAP